MPWTLDLFHLLDEGGGTRSLRFVLPFQTGTGSDAPWIFFHVHGTSSLEDLPEVIWQRLNCHYIIACLPDVAIREIVDSLETSKNRYIPPVKAISSAPPSTHPRITAVLPRTGDPDDDLVVYEEKAHRPTIDWILRLTKKK